LPFFLWAGKMLAEARPPTHCTRWILLHCSLL
jgi:hypothetical protein